MSLIGHDGGQCRHAYFYSPSILLHYYIIVTNRRNIHKILSTSGFLVSLRISAFWTNSIAWVSNHFRWREEFVSCVLFCYQLYFERLFNLSMKTDKTFYYSVSTFSNVHLCRKCTKHSKWKRDRLLVLFEVFKIGCEIGMFGVITPESIQYVS